MLRKALAQKVALGIVNCARCGEPIVPGQPVGFGRTSTPTETMLPGSDTGPQPGDVNSPLTASLEPGAAPPALVEQPVKVNTNSHEHRERRKELRERVQSGFALCVACRGLISRHERWEVHYLADGTHGPRHMRCRGARVGLPLGPPSSESGLPRRTSRLWWRRTFACLDQFTTSGGAGHTVMAGAQTSSWGKVFPGNAARLDRPHPHPDQQASVWLERHITGASGCDPNEPGSAGLDA